MRGRKSFLFYIASLSLVGLLSACGGGSNGNDTGSSSSGGGTGSVIRYDLLQMPSSVGDNLTQLDSAQQRGFRFFSTYSFSGVAYNAYVNDDFGAWTYQALNPPSSGAEALAQRNALGEQGYRFTSKMGDNGAQFIYEKKQGDAATYEYRRLPLPSARGDFEAQVVAQGAEGFMYLGSGTYSGDVFQTVIYVKSSAFASATYTYEFLDNTSSDSDFLAQLNAEGARGYKYQRFEPFVSMSSRIIYAKDNTQNSTFTYRSLPAQNTANSFYDQTNALGAQGYTYTAWIYFGTKSYIYGVDLGHCAGLLCDATLF